MDAARPYLAVFSARFLQMLQYRAAALAGFVTQCWWGGLKVMIYAAFYGASRHAADAPMSLSQVITYTWLCQALLVFSFLTCDPEVARDVRTGGVGYDRLRPVDAYNYWFARAAGWLLARAAPRAALMALGAGVALPLMGLSEWAWRPPSDAAQAAFFVVSAALAAALATTLVMLLNVVVAATLNDRGANAVLQPFTVVLSGSLIPLALFPDWMRTALFLQPLAGLADIPFSIYAGHLAGAGAWAGLGVQLFWVLALGALGRWRLEHVMRRLEVQGG